MKSTSKFINGAVESCGTIKQSQDLAPKCGQLSTVEAKKEIWQTPAPPKRRKRARWGYVYFISDGTDIKIGFSANPSEW